MKIKKALIAMSGGVDSSVAAYMIKEAGYEAIGITMKLYSNEDICLNKSKTCCSLDDIQDARNVAEALDIPYYVLNFTDDFKEKVIDKFVDSYTHAYTPNPCIDCNHFIKFSRLMQRAAELECDYVVTGHYANIEFDGISGRWLLRKGADPSKDQSYVLYSMTQEQLSKTLFPLGRLFKTEIREMASGLKMVTADKHDSQDICFVPDNDYASFIEKYTGKKFPPGDFIDKHGNKLGTHNGIIRYVIGQRKGLGLALPKPMYVSNVNTEDNTVTLVYAEDLLGTSLDAADINLISVPDLYEPKRVKAKIRYKQEEQWATVVQTSENTFHLDFDIPQRAITPGQAVVLYDGDTVVGGGTIIRPSA
ncbi:tRNA 2-thiouridine(34) synthase MnmA [Parasporobacterium paucivorans]|uniref:tRNA-specific 2-thiouridylase MnmA n=1 Tax=Parasporobacterium paucivorans DSM 15970 TaxID=1122934 RepID=A0A1M6BYX5_9FIRM|nr:tRNA 2-thiouridine(34) synthase MnmA [Parasporobacterium paucivorans]SHI54005.1 tRNA-specific 2-thiouridylase [Parasporobacterium paucivorans DSM 15970]